MGKIYEFFSGTNKQNNTGVSKEEIELSKKMGFGYFFKLLKRSMGKLTTLNLVFSLCNFPIVFFLIGRLGGLNETVNTPTNPLFAQLYGIMQYKQSPSTSALYGILGNSTDLQIVSDASRVFMCLGLLLVITVGLSSIGFFYVLRGLARSEYVSVWRDFFDAIKKNFKQGIIIGVIDSLIIYVLLYDFASYYMNSGDFLINVFYFAIILFILIYFVMRFYIYTILVTFDLPIKKIFKNALILSILGFKRNAVALIGSAALILISIYLSILLPHLGIVLPFVITISVIGFLGAYCIYPTIKKYMIDPYYKEHPEELPEESDEEPIFKDRG
ncbi:MAG TPA: hypothetical protein DD733_02345 [Clostridiales bacterium]|nr:DUF624 domain-containing protein [Eubacteriales bacterium]HBR30902.1 hypothetical protein [Clostridiales bacterium]